MTSGAQNGSEETASVGDLNTIVLSAEEAEVCMSKLKCSIQRLHEKHLFPYNPTPLLKRYDQLCNQLQAFKM